MPTIQPYTPFLDEVETFSQFLLRHAFLIPGNFLQNGVRFFSTCPEYFRARYSHFHFAKIVNTFCRFEKTLLNLSGQNKRKRKILYRLFKVDASKKNTLGIALVFNTLSETEHLSFDQILKAISYLIPGIVGVPHMRYRYKDEITGIFYSYLEIEKKRGGGFSLADLKQLQKQLLFEIEESIQPLVPSLFITRNEEEIFKNIVQMGKDFQTIHDIPQATISFQEQTPDGYLHFTVVIMRLITSQSCSLRQLTARLPGMLKCIPEMTSEIGRMGKSHIKEANLMTLEVKSSLFSKKNGSIDLHEARAYVAKGIELMIGKYRDYNGGLFSIQHEQLKEIKNILGNSNKGFMESLFYSFTPSLFQSFILPKAIKACATLIFDAQGKQLDSKHPYYSIERVEEHFSLLVIKTLDEHLKNSIQKEVSRFSFPLHQFGYAFKLIEGEHFLVFLYQYPQNLLWLDSIKKLLKPSSHLPKQEKRLLRINFQDGDPLSLNPQFGIDLRCRSIQKALFEGLTRINPEGAIELSAAKKVEIDDQEREYLFTLRELQWSNGEELTAYHFEKSWKRMILSSSCLRPDIFYVIQNARKARFGQTSLENVGIQALNKQTLKISLEYPAPYFMQLLAHPLFFPLYEKHGEPFVFSGPFTLHSWKRDQSLVLIKNPFYWDFERVKLDGIEISIIRDPFLAYKKYQKGELDWIGGPFSLIPPSLQETIQQNLKRVDTSGLNWLYCNLEQPLLSSAKIRRAFSLSLDRKKICQNLFLNPIPCETLIPTPLSHLQNFAEANEDILGLFNEGLKEVKQTRHSTPFLQFFHSDIPGQKELACEVQKQWQKTFGIKIDRIEVTWNTFSQQLDNRLFHFGGCHRHPFYNDPMYFYNIFYDPNNIHNAFGWQSERFNHWINQARAHPKEESHLKKAEKELQIEMPVIPIHLVTYYYLALEEVEGIHICHSGDVDFRWIYFNKRTP